MNDSTVKGHRPLAVLVRIRTWRSKTCGITYHCGQVFASDWDNMEWRLLGGWPMDSGTESAAEYTAKEVLQCCGLLPGTGIMNLYAACEKAGILVAVATERVHKCNMFKTYRAPDYHMKKLEAHAAAEGARVEWEREGSIMTLRYFMGGVLKHMVSFSVSGSELAVFLARRDLAEQVCIEIGI